MKKILLSMAVAGLLAVNASATIVLVDDFDDPQGPLFVGGFGTGSVSTAFQPSAVFERQLTLNATVAGFQAVTVTGLGRWEQATSPSSVNNAGAIYRATGGGGTIDLTGLNFFRLSIETVDVLGGTIEFFITDSGGTFTSAPQALSPLAPPSFLRTFLVGSFTGVDLADVQSFGFLVRGVNDLDVGIDNLEYDYTESTVPEPTSMALMGIGLLGLGILGRRIGK